MRRLEAEQQLPRRGPQGLSPDATGRGGSNSATADAAPARCASQAHVREAGVTVRRYYERLPRDGWTRMR